MLRKILRIRNVGLLKDATADGPAVLGRVSAVYADNGRGKSTLAAVLRASQLGEAGRLTARHTIGATTAPEVTLLLHSGAQAIFDGASWSAAVPQLVVFDSEFVEQNVYSGFEVRADQRQSLLEFALGDQTVPLKRNIDRLAQEIEVQTRRRSSAERILDGFAKPYSISDFITLIPRPNLSDLTDELLKRIEAAKNSAHLASRKDPEQLGPLRFDLPSFLAVLRTQLADVEHAAEDAVKAHLATHASDDLENWISRGLRLAPRDTCPFCGQSTTGLPLIAAYRSYFNASYSDLKRRVEELPVQVERFLSRARMDQLLAEAATSVARLEAWSDQVSISQPLLDGDAIRTAATRVLERLVDLVAAKQRSPLDSVATADDEAFVATELASITAAIDAFNASVRGQTTAIREFRQRLAAANPAALATDLKKLEAEARRELPEVVAAIAEYLSADSERGRLDEEKTQTRQQLDTLMQETLAQYQSDINSLLGTFGAEFSIEKLKPTYQGGGEPRSEYGLRLREKSVRLGSRTDLTTGHSFATALSEADKRTLAFAFFLAKLQSDPVVGQKIVVLDDPVSSLDRNRRTQTIRRTAALARVCAQVIVLSHDAFFVRDLRDHLGNPANGATDLTTLRLLRVADGYSVFADCDIDELCESSYYRHHRLVSDFAEGLPVKSMREVAQSIRPLLEGYYHRRFPKRLPKRTMFGRVIESAASAVPPDPLAHLAPILPELREVNDYANQFHHESGDAQEIIEPELLQMAKKALDLIHRNG